ncbi:MAG: hypothetical protein AAB250_17810, partial [Bdellovibrionota bacterium]
TRLLAALDVSFINVEMGTSEFTPTNFERTLKWMNQVAGIARKRNVATLMKIHVSTGQKDDTYGNFNFLPTFAESDVGILPHTVYLYEVEAESAPMYGNANFKAIRDFTLAEKSKRRTWLYPETSYFCALDIDVPLLLTDYLLARAKDFSFVSRNGIEGQLTFTTGHEAGYWLFDWTTALLNDLELQFDPYSGLDLLGENRSSWEKIVGFQHRFIVANGAIGPITGTEVGHELFYSFHQTLKKKLLKDLRDDANLLNDEIRILEESVANIPVGITIKNSELAALWKITTLRIRHALETRRALAFKEKRSVHLANAKALREEAQDEMNFVARDHSRYPEARVFEWHSNPTSYPYGYLYPAKTLHYWLREERVVETGNYHPFFRSLLTPLDVMAGPVL